MTSAENRGPGWMAGTRTIRKVAIGVFATLIWAGATYWLYPLAGSSARALTLILILVVAWWGGTWWGLACALGGVPLNLLLAAAAGQHFDLGYSLPYIVVGIALGLLVGRLSDVARRKNHALEGRAEVERLLRESEAGYRVLFEKNPQPMWVCQADTLAILAVNHAAIEHYGYSAEEFARMTASDLLVAAEGSGLRRGLPPSWPSLHPPGLLKHQKKDGTRIDVELATLPLLFHGEPCKLLLAFDVTERLRAQEGLEYQALHDELTGLPNRSLIMRHLKQCLNLSHRKRRHAALLLIDLDRFKEVNDALGHHVGDRVLRDLSARFHQTLRDSDMIARLGGDEFAVLLPDTDAAGAEHSSRRLLASLNKPFCVDAHKFELGASVGVAVYPEDGHDPETLLRMADVAMYAAKRTGGRTLAYAASQCEPTVRRLSLVGELRQGIENNQLLLHYQPEIDMHTGQARTAEALVRWQHPREGLMTPAQFIPLAEHTGLIGPLSLWVLNTALLQSRVWRRAGLNLDVSVNIPACLLEESKLIETIRGLLEATDSLPQWLTVEVTESALMADPAATTAVIAGLHAMGIKIAIDDFGTGSAALGYLKDWPVDKVKIDRSLIKDMTYDSGADTIVRSVIEMCHSLGIKVVAEGVENAETRDRLAALDCELVQGFLLSPPLPPAEFTDWLAQSRPGLVEV